MTHARRMGQQGSQAMHACVHRDSCVMANHLPVPRCQPATRWVLDVSKTRLLNVCERHLSISHELPIALALLTTRLLQSMVGGCRGS